MRHKRAIVKPKPLQARRRQGLFTQCKVLICQRLSVGRCGRKHAV